MGTPLDTTFEIRRESGPLSMKMPPGTTAPRSIEAALRKVVGTGPGS